MSIAELSDKLSMHLRSNLFPSEHLPLKVPDVEFDFDVSVRPCLLSTHTTKLNLTLGTHLHAMISTHHCYSMLGFDLSVHLCQKPNIQY